jgi:hypothetical protein
MATETTADAVVDADALREEVKSKYREVATDPHAEFHFHTGRYLAKHLGYDGVFVGSLPDAAVESFAGVANPFSLQPLSAGERVSSTSGRVRASIRLSLPIRSDRADGWSAST